MSIGCHGTSYAARGNFMDLDPDYRDAYGRPLLRITFDFPANDLRMSKFVTDKAHGIARASGAQIVTPPGPRSGPYDSRQYQSTHNTGGTIVGSDRDSSVVSPHLQSWDATNLFITGASVFPQNSGYNPTGPALAGVLGCATASVADFRYSRPMARAGITWDEATLDRYLAEPQAVVPGTRMAFAGLPQAADRADLIAFLKAQK